MPRKTRKQKTQASARRLKATSDGVPGSFVKREFSFDRRLVFPKTFEAKMGKKSDKSATFSQEVFYLPDLVRSVLLALVILALELVIYWARA